MIDNMNTYKRGKRYWLKFVDHQHIVRRLRATQDKRSSESMARLVGALVDSAASGQAIPDEAADWALRLDRKRRDKIIAWGLLTAERIAAADGLTKQIADWRDFLASKGRPDKYTDLRHNRALELLVTACGFAFVRDITAEAVQAQVAEWKRDGARSDYTIAHYLGAAKGFTRWLVRTNRTTRDPLMILTPQRGKARKVRRALTEAEQVKLVAHCPACVRNGMAAVDRAMLYRVALSTGLRAGALRRLTVGDVDLHNCVLLAVGSGADNKHSSAKPMPGHLADALRTYVAGRQTDVALFATMPDEHRLSVMLKGDAVDLGISTDGLDFHALRHTFGTTMARRGVHPKTLMSLMDHHSVGLTMRLYVHAFPEDELAAVQQLPDLSEQPNTQRASA